MTRLPFFLHLRKHTTHMHWVKAKCVPALSARLSSRHQKSDFCTPDAKKTQNAAFWGIAAESGETLFVGRPSRAIHMSPQTGSGIWMAARPRRMRTCFPGNRTCMDLQALNFLESAPWCENRSHLLCSVRIKTDQAELFPCFLVSSQSERDSRAS